MAALSRSPPLLLLLSSLCLWSSVTVLGVKVASGPVELPKQPDVRAVEPAAKDAPVAVAAGASPPRRASGWKLAEEEACREDLTRLCPKQTWTNNLAVLECLQDRREETELAPDCNHLLWNYKLNLTTDPKFESVATEVCRSTIAEIKECNEEERGRGYLVSCLVDHRGNISEYQCNQYITKITSIIFSDYRLICGFMDKCKEDINSLRCGSISVGQKVSGVRVQRSDSQLLINHLFFASYVPLVGDTRAVKSSRSTACRDALTTRQKLISQDYRVSYSLAKACKLDLRKQRCSLDTSLPRAREARLSYLLLCLEAAVHRGRPVSGECQGEMLDFRRLLMEDFSLSPEIVLHCRTEIEAQCSGLHRKGRTLHCLMRLGRGDRSSALQTLIQSADPGADYRIDRALNEACESVIQTACKHIRSGDPISFKSRLKTHLLDPILYRKCQGDAARLCHTHGWNETSELMPPGAVFSCLYRHAYRTEEQGRRVKMKRKNTRGSPLSRDCKVEVQRILHQRALDVKLDPELQKRCMTDLGKWCSEKTDTGQVRRAGGDRLVSLALRRELHVFLPCYSLYDVADNQVDTGDLMECLVQNKHQKEMNDKCAVGVTHFQLIQMKDFRFSYKFKMACKEDVLRLCPNIKKKVDVVICLSTTVRNDTLQDVREQRVSVKCRKQLRVEELEMSEDIRLEPELYEPCKSDISRLCPNVAFGNAQMIECLKEQKKQLSQRCHQRIFKLQEVEMSDPELDYQLMRVCKQMIKRFCTEADARNVLQCLKQNKNSELMDPKCKQMITKRQITQNTDYRLNPVLRKACRADIPKFCQSILNKANEDSELEGQIIACLKLKYADQRLSPDCEDQIRVILQESALDYRLDPQLQMHCSDEVNPLSVLDINTFTERRTCLAATRRRKASGFFFPPSALQVAPAESFSDLAVQVMTSPSKNYILLMMALSVCVLFLVGLLCGRITKRVTRELKNRNMHKKKKKEVPLWRSCRDPQDS
uniref:Golgi apparatus protein 1 n=1 Tax=Fundulus heteroclitus TaxID=8078 RepID=A0A3Q2QJ59_FUNHE